MSNKSEGANELLWMRVRVESTGIEILFQKTVMQSCAPGLSSQSRPWKRETRDLICMIKRHLITAKVALI